MPEHRPQSDYEMLAHDLAHDAGVITATVIEDDDRVGGPCVEVLVGHDYDRVPPRILRFVGEADCGIVDVTSKQGDEGRYFVVTAV